MVTLDSISRPGKAKHCVSMARIKMSKLGSFGVADAGQRSALATIIGAGQLNALNSLLLLHAARRAAPIHTNTSGETDFIVLA